MYATAVTPCAAETLRGHSSCWGTFMHRAAVALLLGAACLAPVAARAQSRWEDQVHNQIKHAGRILEDKGYTMTHDEYSGNLKESESEYLNITLHAGTD